MNWKIEITPEVVYKLGLAVESGHLEDQQRRHWGDATVDWIIEAHKHPDLIQWFKNNGIPYATKGEK